MDIEICPYEAWMKPQIAKLFSKEYGVTENSFSNLMDQFYDSNYQKDKCIRIVAKQGSKIIGFQSFFYWPYFYNGKKYNSYQSGNSLVDPNFRGKGVFQKLLNYLNYNSEALNIDFLIGFPIDVSKGSLTRNGWNNPFDLEWRVKMISIFSIFFDAEKLINKYFSITDFKVQDNNDSIRLSQEVEFLDWRNIYFSNSVYYHKYNDSKHEAVFSLKLIRRKKYIKELIIGDIRATNYGSDFLEKAFDSLRVTAKNAKFITFLSCAYNPFSNINIGNVLKESGYRKIKNKIYFQTKIFGQSSKFLKKENWAIYRSDVDTW